MEKTYIYDGAPSDNGILTAAMMNGGGMGNMNNPFWAIVLLAFLRNNFGFDGGSNANPAFLATQVNQAVAGNANAISNLSTQLNCSIGQVRTGIDAIQASIANVANQTGMTGMQIINAIQAGNTAIANQISQCCCDNKLLATQQGYENRIATAEQTAILGGKIDAQTTLINDKFCQLEMREMQNKLDSERQKNLALTNQLSQEHQNATFAAMLAPLQADINEIKCKQPASVTIPYSPVVGVPSCVAWNSALYGGAYPFANGGQFG